MGSQIGTNRLPAPALLYFNVLALLLARHTRAESVRVDFGHWLQPLVSRSDNLTILNNSDVILQLRCMASYPTEWVAYNFDDQARNHPGTIRIEWTDRKFDKSIDEAQYDYIAWIQLQYQTLREEELIICRSVANHADSMLVKFTHVPDAGHFHITKHPIPPKSTSTTNSGPCHIKFEVTHLASGYYWRCTGQDTQSRGLIQFHDCTAASLCANSWRSIRTLPNCLTVVNNLTSIDVINDRTWARMPRLDKHVQPGIAVCDGTGQLTRGAMEYFFEGKAAAGTDGTRKIHFSQPDIPMRDLIWMEPPVSREIYYTREILETHCIIPKYGFSFDPVVIVTLNGSRLLLDRGYDEIDGDEKLWSKAVTVNFPHFGVGIYQIHCIGPVWNTTEWANYTKTVQVKNVVPPRLESGPEVVNVTYAEGDINKGLVCDASGDPAPKITWDYANLPGIRTDGPMLTFSRISAVLYEGSLITCIAENEFGQSVSKSFMVNVKDKITESDSSESFSTATVGGIVGASLFGILLVAALVFLYFKFLKLGSAIATYLTYDEVKEFREGKKTAGVGNAKSSSGYVNADAAQKQKEEDEQLSIECLPYNSEFEVAKENMIVDLTSELGSGEYGIVYKGQIKLNSRDQNPMNVAVKTVRKNVHISYFKALMSELKILAYIGHHDFIVNLIGAYSTNIKNRELYVGVELCKTSLLQFLQENRPTFKNFVQSKTGVLSEETSFSDYQNQTGADPVKTITTFELIRWAREIAAGMEFLAKKRVVHGDLAARNILVSFDLHAKICDFGLARQLIDYNYIKSQQCPLPWKWMAIESLAQMKFSTKSDVWAYGVTLWEIFSLGNVPYPGMAWNMDFVDQLLNGLRMSKPMYASDRIYNTMLECWREQPKDRPTFTDLKQIFQSLEVK